MTEQNEGKPIVIHYPRFNELYQAIQTCQRITRQAGEPRCMSLEGRPGAGKTTLAENFTEAFPRYDTPEGVKIPVFYFLTPSPVTVKGMAAKMLEKLGDPAAFKGPLWSMNSRLVYYIREACEVKLVILDDFHNLIDKQTNRILETVSDWLKVLIKETRTPFLVVGIEGKVEQILGANDQLSRLFPVREKLKPFQWNREDEEVIKEFAAFIKYAETGVGATLSTELPRVQLLERIHYATGGVVGNIMNLMYFTADAARLQRSKTITLALLSRVFTEQLQKHVQLKDNPFVNGRFTPPVAAPQVIPTGDPPDSTNNRSQPRKDREPTAGEVLKK